MLFFRFFIILDRVNSFRAKIRKYRTNIPRKKMLIFFAELQNSEQKFSEYEGKFAHFFVGSLLPLENLGLIEDDKNIVFNCGNI